MGEMYGDLKFIDTTVDSTIDKTNSKIFLNDQIRIDVHR
jgi:hypothetical protein